MERGVPPAQLDIDHSRSEDYDAYLIIVKVRYLDDEEAATMQNGTSVPDSLFPSRLAKDDRNNLIRKSQGKEGTTEHIRAKNMIGYDGAYSKSPSLS